MHQVGAPGVKFSSGGDTLGDAPGGSRRGIGGQSVGAPGTAFWWGAAPGDAPEWTRLVHAKPSSSGCHTLGMHRLGAPEMTS
jgi:hypothetical protein